LAAPLPGSSGLPSFWIGTYLVIRRVLRYFEAVHELGPALAYQLLLIILLTFLSMFCSAIWSRRIRVFFSRASGLVHSDAGFRPTGFFFRALDSHHGQFVVDGVFFSIPIFAATAVVRRRLGFFTLGPPSCRFSTHSGGDRILITTSWLLLPQRRIRTCFFIGLIAFIVMYFFRFSNLTLVHRSPSAISYQFLTAMETLRRVPRASSPRSAEIWPERF